jgi:hypothetical protein
MGIVDVRRFDVTTGFAPTGQLAVQHIKVAGRDKWDINLAEIIKVNALAVPADRTITYRVMKHELRLLLSFLSDHPRGPLALRDAAFSGSSGHVKRFVSESLGLGMLTAAAERRHRWKLNSSSLHNFDVLPANVADLYARSGVRPDLLFEFLHQGKQSRLAGEARGRLSSSRPILTTKDQRDRLEQIVAWSGFNDLHPVTMTYTYPGTTNVEVDLFEIDLPSFPGAATDAAEAEGESFATTTAGQQYAPAASIGSRAQARAADVTARLYETAPQDEPGLPRRVFGRNVRGSWASADMLTDSGLRFFLGLLDRPVTAQQAGNARRAGEQDRSPIQIAVTGRVFAVVARDTAEEPAWTQVVNRIE